jgi:small-conductance mechanosensitive channel
MLEESINGESMTLRLFKSVICFLIMGGVAWGAPQQGSVKGSSETVPPRMEAPVVFAGKTLFLIREKVFSYSQEARALAISERLARFAKDPLFHPERIKAVDDEFTTNIISDDHLIMVVTEKDASIEGKTRQALANGYASLMRTTMQEYIDDRSTKHILLDILYALAVTVVAIALLVVIIRGLRKIQERIESWQGTLADSQQLQSVEFFKRNLLRPLASFIIKALRVLLIVAVLYLYIPLELSFFPGTRGVAATVFGYILTPFKTIWQSFSSYLPNLFFVVAIMVIAWYAMKFVRIVFDELGKGAIVIRGFDPDWAEHTSKIVNFLVIVFAAVVAFPYLPGSKSEAFRGISIFLGVLFSLGSTSAVANMVSGVILTYTNAFKIGDRIRIGDNFGDVLSNSLLTTRIMTPKNVIITIPNATVLGSHIANYNQMARTQSLILHTSITIGYDAPWRTVHGLLIAAAGATEHILADPAPFVLQTALNDFYVTYELNAHTDKPQLMLETYSELHQNIQDKFNEAGVEIMSPHYAQIRDGNRTTIPDAYLPDGYQAGGIRISSASPPDLTAGS